MPADGLQASARRPRILVFDTQPQRLAPLIAHLEDLDTECIDMRGETALDSLTDDNCAAMLVDWDIAEPGVLALTERIRANAHAQHVPILISAPEHAPVGWCARAYAAGATDCISAPYDVTALHGKLRAYASLKRREWNLAEAIQRLEREKRALEEELAERKRMEQELVEGEVRYRALVELSPVAIVVEVGGKMQYINTAVLKLLGASDRDELIGHSIYDFLHSDSRETCMNQINEIVRQGGRTEGLEGQFQRIDGTGVHVEMGCACVIYEGDVGVQLAIQDVTERKQLEHELRRLSQRDGLTGIANRRCLDETIDRECRRAARTGLALSVVMIDIDAFKKYNDHYGHQAGDAVLKNAALALEGAVRRGSDLVARYGGEEFVAILCETPLEGALIVAEKMRDAVELLRIPHAQNPAAEWVTISVGVAASMPAEHPTPPLLLARADRALYTSKSGGRNRVTAYSPPPAA